MVRVTIINFLTKLQPTCEDHGRFVAQLIQALMRKHEDVNRMKAAWNFVNSLQHRVRHRVSQALLVLEPFIQTKVCTLSFIVPVLLVSKSPEANEYHNQTVVCS